MAALPPSKDRYRALLDEREALLNNAQAHRLPRPNAELAQLELQLLLNSETDALIREWFTRASETIYAVPMHLRAAFAELQADAEQRWREMVWRTTPAIVDSPADAGDGRDYDHDEERDRAEMVRS